MRGVSRLRTDACTSTHGAIPFLCPYFPVLAFALYLGGVPLVPAAPETRFTSPANPTSSSDEGFVKLEWNPSVVDAGLRFELQQSARADFADDAVTRYLGPDTASVLTGFAEGTYHFRVRALDATGGGAWSPPVSVEIAYMPRERVILLLVVGIAVFAATLTALLAGHFRKSASD